MRYGIEFNDSNKESFKMSIIYSLNADLLELKSKINFELLEAYTDGVLKRELKVLKPITQVAIMKKAGIKRLLKNLFFCLLTK